MNFHSAVLRRIEQKLWAYTKIYFFLQINENVCRRNIESLDRLDGIIIMS